MPAPTTTVKSPGSCSTIASEAFGNARQLQWMCAIRAGHLAAEPRRRKDLARVREAVRIECPPEPLHHFEIGLAEHQRHRARLVGTDAVLPCDRAARVDARFEDAVRELFCACR